MRLARGSAGLKPLHGLLLLRTWVCNYTIREVSLFVFQELPSSACLQYNSFFGGKNIINYSILLLWLIVIQDVHIQSILSFVKQNSIPWEDQWQIRTLKYCSFLCKREIGIWVHPHHLSKWHRLTSVPLQVAWDCAWLCRSPMFALSGIISFQCKRLSVCHHKPKHQLQQAKQQVLFQQDWRLLGYLRSQKEGERCFLP